LPATKVELAKEVAGDSKWTVDLTDTKTDTDYVALGAVRLTEATSFKIGVVGWGTSHSMIIDVQSSFLNNSFFRNNFARGCYWIAGVEANISATQQYASRVPSLTIAIHNFFATHGWCFVCNTTNPNLNPNP
jgi:hypothetical protein